MKNLFLIFVLLTLGCSSPGTNKKLSESDQYIDSISILDFLNSPCDYANLEFNCIYSDLEYISDDENEKLIILDSLKSRGYIVVKYGRGNWEKGPRIVNYEVTNYYCDCQIDKLYYSTKSNSEKFRVTERVSCKEKNDELKQYIPEGYEILDSISGHINNDSLTDVILVLKKSEEIATEEKRPVLVLLKSNTGYVLNSKNDECMLSWDGGGVHGDPYDRIELKNKEFKIVHFGGSSWKWSQEMNFKFDDNQNEFIPSKYINRSFWSMNPDSTMRVDSLVYSKNDTTLRNYINPY